MTDTPRYQVICHITEQEYEEQRERAHDDGEERILRPILYACTAQNGDPIFEDDVTLMVRDALLALSEGEDNEELEGRDRQDFDAMELPFELKLLVMEAAKENWDPPRQSGNHFEPSYWCGPKEKAKELLDKNPELRDIFKRSPEEISEAWSLRAKQRRGGRKG